MTNKYDLSSAELSGINIINPELAAHNIALAYVNSATSNKKLLNNEDVDPSDLLSLSDQYVQAYNYAYNFVIHQNKLINEAE